MTIYYASSIPAFVEALSTMIRDGWLMDVIAVAEDGLFQPAVIAHRDRDDAMQVVRFNAMTESTHYAKRTAARAAAEAYIELARADA